MSPIAMRVVVNLPAYFYSVFGLFVFLPVQFSGFAAPPLFSLIKIIIYIDCLALILSVLLLERFD